MFSRLYFTVAIILLLASCQSSVNNDCVYILYKKNDYFKSYASEKHQELFPISFNASKTEVDISELAKLNKFQRDKFDSILKTDFEYPKKVLRIENGKKYYSIALSPVESINFSVENLKKISKHEINKYKTIALDSILDYLDKNHDGYFLDSGDSKVCIIDISENDQVYLIQSTSVFVEYI